MNQETGSTQDNSVVILPVITLPPYFETVFIQKPKRSLTRDCMIGTALKIERDMSLRAAHAALDSNMRVLLLHQEHETEDDAEPTPEDMCDLGVVATIVEPYDPKDGSLKIAIDTTARAIVAHLHTG